MKFYNGIYAASERNAALRVFIALGFDFYSAFNLSCGDLIDGTLVYVGRYASN